MSPDIHVSNKVKELNDVLDRLIDWPIRTPVSAIKFIDPERVDKAIKCLREIKAFRIKVKS